MSRDDSEFTTYLAARWPALVRTLVLLGHPEPDAHAIALDGLVRIYPDWHRVSREEDVDVAVYREVLDARDRHLRDADAATDAPDPAPVTRTCLPDWRSGRAPRAARGRPGSDDAGGPDGGGARDVAELSEDQVADVLDAARAVSRPPARRRRRTRSPSRRSRSTRSASRTSLSARGPGVGRRGPAPRAVAAALVVLVAGRELGRQPARHGRRRRAGREPAARRVVRRRHAPPDRRHRRRPAGAPAGRRCRTGSC